MRKKNSRHLLPSSNCRKNCQLHSEEKSGIRSSVDRKVVDSFGRLNWPDYRFDEQEIAMSLGLDSHPADTLMALDEDLTLDVKKDAKEHCTRYLLPNTCNGTAMTVVQCPLHSNLSLIPQTSILSFSPSANTSL